MNKEEKATEVADLQQALARAQSLVLADFRGLTVQQTNELRRALRSQDCHYRVVKNTLVKRAISNTPMALVGPLLTGPTAIAFSYVDPVAPAKVVSKFEGDLPKLTIKGGYVDGQVLDAAGVKQLSQMKGKDQLRAEFLATLVAPAQQFVRLLAAAPMNLLYALQARGRQMDGRADGGASES